MKIQLKDKCTILSERVVSSRLEVVGVTGGGSVVNGSSSLVVLDCRYAVPPGKEEGLVVKWYYNDNPSPVYQWIKGTQPQVMQIFSHIVTKCYINAIS